VDPSFSRIAPRDLLLLLAYSAMAACAVNALHVVVTRLSNQVELTNRLDKAVSQLIDANIGFQKYAATAGEESASQERRRVSRDIHDTAVHSLVNIIMLAESISDKISPDQTAVYDMLQMIIAQGKDAVGDTRQSLRDLRAIEQQPRKGLKQIHRLIKVFSQATGIEVGINYGNLPWEFGNEIDETIYRMIQEGMTNAFRHGKATRIQISLWITTTDLVPELNVSISDNGFGSQEVKQGIGLQGMEERLRKLGGSIEAKNVPGGFSVSGVIPLRTAVEEG
jgi:signal transduction histidine kinase